MVLKLILTFIATISFGILFQVPPRTLITGGIIGIIGWEIKQISIGYALQPALGTLIASFTVATISQFLARWYKVPVTVFSIAGIIPLVPGYLAYSTMRYFVNGHVMDGITTGLNTAFSAGAIAAGLIFSEGLTRAFKGKRKHRHAG